MKKRDDERPEHERAHEREREYHEERRERPRGHGRERAVFLDYIARRWQGSAPPTAEAYARALRQWRQLPGSVITAPNDLAEIPKPTSGDPKDAGKS